jgi:hypothetical protein
MSRIAFLLAFSAAAVAQPGIAPPQLGFVADAANALRPVYGVSGNFVLGPAVAGAVVSEAFSGSLGLFKTGKSLAAFNASGDRLASIPASQGPAYFAFSPAGTAALAYIASNKALIEWSGAAFRTIPLDTAAFGDSKVVGIAFPAAGEATLIVERSREELWQLQFALGDGSLIAQEALPGVHAPVLALPSGSLVYPAAGEIVIRRPDATEVRLARPRQADFPLADFSLQQMNQDWVQLTEINGRGRFAMHTAPAREALYQLPK